jgi:hypothetical protein
LAVNALAQREPRLGYAYPAGGASGTTFQVVLGGQNLAGPAQVLVTGDGITAAVQDYERPLSQKRVNEMRDQLQEVRQAMGEARKQGRFGSPDEGMQLFLQLTQERGMTKEELKKAVEFRQQRQDPKRQPNAQLAESVTVRMTVAADAAPGMRELRLLTRAGLSNPLRFSIGQWREVCEPRQEPELTWEDLIGIRNPGRAGDPAVPPAPKCALPTVINGQILPGEEDEFRFTGRRGQQLVAAVSAQSLMPYLADAVPGWFQPVLTLGDVHGNEVAYADDFQFHPDPVLACVLPKDGEYVLRIRDSIFRGREDFVYRIAVGEIPFITGCFPLGGPARECTLVELSGWNLPTNRLVVTPLSAGVETMTISVEKAGGSSNAKSFARGQQSEILEREPNNLPAHAQSVSLPVVVNGRIQPDGDCDVYRFEGRAGQSITAEVFARRLDSPLDSILKLTDDSGRELASNDDHADPAAGLITHHADSRLEAVLPADGWYRLSLADAQGEGGAARGYRLAVLPTRPDFKLRMVPSSLSLRPGSTASVTVHVLRVGGFTNDIRLTLKNAPSGFALLNPVLSGETNRFEVKLKAPTSAGGVGVWNLEVEGVALMGGEQVIRPVVPADDLMQAFLYRHLVPAQQFSVAILGRNPPGKGTTAASQKKPVGTP